jgi:hypothetical protein
MQEKIAIVCGGRNYADKERLFALLDMTRYVHAITKIAHGGATGADALAGEWAWQRGLECRSYEAAWKKHGNSAGPIRNQRMLDAEKPDLVIAFPGGRGTADMVQRARAADIFVVEVTE